jgi:hypothetical protein
VQSKILLRRAKTNLRLQEQSVTVDVRNSVRDLQSAIDGVKAAQRARIASEESLRAEQEARLGDSRPHVLDYDEDLRLAESRDPRAAGLSHRNRRARARPGYAPRQARHQRRGRTRARRRRLLSARRVRLS